MVKIIDVVGGLPVGSKPEKRNDGGPAFPFEFEDRQADGSVQALVHTGMSLRDYFAGQVLPEVYRAGCRTKATIQDITQKSYDVADAMIEARKR